MKNFFIDGGTLSEPRSDTADNIARKFLADITHSSHFPPPIVEELKLENGITIRELLSSTTRRLSMV